MKRMNKIVLMTLFIVSSWFTPALAQEASPETSTNPEEFRPSLEHTLGEITEVLSDDSKELAGQTHRVQKLKAKILQGSEKGEIVELRDHIVTQDAQALSVGDRVVITKQTSLAGPSYFASDRYRLPSFGFIFMIFLGLAILFARRKGAMAILGLLVSLFILVRFVVPQILSGANPLLVSLGGAVVIAVLSLYLAHGFNRRSSIALGSTLITLGLAAALSILFVSLAKLTGLGDDDAFYLQLGPVDSLNLRGLLLGGIIIGALGVLDDVTTSQVAAVDEIHSANPRLNFAELYKRGLSVGQEHIASLVNTLVLAYVGASFPLFLMFAINNEMPLWVKLNSEIIAEEVVRTLVGSSALIVAVPIATFLAAYFFEGREPSRKESPAEGYHRH